MQTGASFEKSWRTETVRYARELSLCLAWLTVYAARLHLPVWSLLGGLAVFTTAGWPTLSPRWRLSCGAAGAALVLLFGPLTPAGLAASTGVSGLALYRGWRAQALPEDPAGAFVSGALQFVLLWWAAPPTAASGGLVALTLAFLVTALMRMVQCAVRDDTGRSRPLPTSGAAVLAVLAPLAAALAATGLLRPGLLRETWDALASVLASALALLAYPFVRLAELSVRALKARPAVSQGWQLPAQPALVLESSPPGVGTRIVGIVILLVCGAPLVLWLGTVLFVWLRSALRAEVTADARSAPVQIVRERLSAVDAANDLRAHQRPRYGRDQAGRIRRLYWLAARQARRLGCPVTAGTTPALLQELLLQLYPDYGRTLESLIAAYNQVRYGVQRPQDIDVSLLEREWAALVRSQPLPRYSDGQVRSAANRR